MMFFGPNAASPPKNTFGLVEPMVLVSTFGMFHLSNSTPQSRSIQGKAFSWPTATSTSSHTMVWSGSPAGMRLPRPVASYSAFTDLFDVAKRYAGEPIDADVDIAGSFLAAGNLQLAPTRRAGADKDRIVIFSEQLLQAVDALTAPELNAEIEDVVGFLIDHRIRQPEFRNLRTHHAAGLGVGVEHGAMIAKRREIARHR